METKIISAFCGCGKTTANKLIESSIEIEYHNYEGLQKEYIDEVKKCFGNFEYIFISTDPEGLNLINDAGFNITLIYPENELRNEYLDRYLKRDSPYDFIGTYMKHWDIWINQLKGINYCNHIILKKGQYITDVLAIKK